MGAIVKMAAEKRATNYLGLKLAKDLGHSVTNSNMGCEVSGMPVVVIASGPDAGQELEGSVLKSGQKVVLKIGSIRPTKYHAMMQPNPALAAVGCSVGMIILEPGELMDVDLILKPDKSFDLLSLEYLIRLYVID